MPCTTSTPPVVYIKADPEQCICRGTGEYWVVGKSPEIYNVFSVYPDMPYLDQMLVPCQQHRSTTFSVSDIMMLEELGIESPTASLPKE